MMSTLTLPTTTTLFIDAACYCPRRRSVSTMPIPEFVLTLRAKIGHDPLPLPGVTAVVLDDRNRVLLVRRADNGQWTLITGCLDPGEQPAAGALREIMEETAVVATVERLLSVTALDMITCPNGDLVHWYDTALRCRYVSGDARVNDDESVDVGWFEVDAVPELSPHQALCLKRALAPDGDAWFEPAPAPAPA
jgi:ADP-ribose pyrophosphatase YjhB (NUDIX family)